MGNLDPLLEEDIKVIIGWVLFFGAIVGGLALAFL